MQRRNRQAAQSGKMLVPLLSVVAVLAIGVAAVAIVLKFQEQEKRLAKERELQQAQSQMEVLRGQLGETKQAKAQVETELKSVRAELAKTGEELQLAVAKQTELTKAIEDRDKEVSRLAKDLQQAKSESKTIEARVTQLQTEREGLKQQVAELEKAKAAEAQEQAAGEGAVDPSTVELGRVRVTPETGAAVRPSSSDASKALALAGSSDGQVVVVNREYDFIVMNMGKNQGLSVGQEFQIVRNNQVLGKVKIEKVYDELSAAAILPESKKDSIREGDAVRAL